MSPCGTRQALKLLGWTSECVHSWWIVTAAESPQGSVDPSDFLFQLVSVLVCCIFQWICPSHLSFQKCWYKGHTISWLSLSGLQNRVTLWSFIPDTGNLCSLPFVSGHSRQALIIRLMISVKQLRCHWFFSTVFPPLVSLISMLYSLFFVLFILASQDRTWNF